MDRKAMAVRLSCTKFSWRAFTAGLGALLLICMLNPSSARLFAVIQTDIAFNNFPTEHMPRAYNTIRFYYGEGQINTALNCNGVLWLRGYVAQNEQYAIRIWSDITGFTRNEPQDVKFWYAVLRRVYELPYVPDRYVITMSGTSVTTPMPKYNKDTPISPPAVERYPSIQRLFAKLQLPPEEFGQPVEPLVRSPGLTQGRENDAPNHR